MNATGRGIVLLLFVMAPAGLRAGTIVTVTCNDGSQNQQFSGSQSADCSLTGQLGIVSGSGAVSAGSLSVQSFAFSLYPDPFATADASWDVVFTTAEVLTWQIGWSYGADYSMTLDMAGQYAPLGQWVSENLTGAVWNQTVAPGEYTFSAFTQDCGEGNAALWANLIGTAPAGDPAPEPGTWMLAVAAFAGFSLLGAARRSARRRGVNLAR